MIKNLGQYFSRKEAREISKNIPNSYIEKDKKPNWNITNWKQTYTIKKK